MVKHHTLTIAIFSTLFVFATAKAGSATAHAQSPRIQLENNHIEDTTVNADLHREETHVVSSKDDDYLGEGDAHTSSRTISYDPATRTRRRRYRKNFRPVREKSNIKESLLSGKDYSSALMTLAGLLVAGAVAVITLQSLNKKDESLPQIVRVAVAVPEPDTKNNAVTATKKTEKFQAIRAILAMATSSKFIIFAVALLTAFALLGTVKEFLLYGLGYLAIRAILSGQAKIAELRRKMDQRKEDRYDRLTNVLITMAPHDQKERSILKTRCMQALQFLALVEDQQFRHVTWIVHRNELRDFRFGAYAVAQWLGTASRAMRLSPRQEAKQPDVKNELLKISRLHDILIRTTDVHALPQPDEFQVPPYNVDNNGRMIIPAMNRNDLQSLVQIISRVSEKL